jgi:ATP-dependent RNA helicase RhlE
VHAPALEPTLCDTMPVPFASFALDPRLLEGVRDLGFTETRPIQTAVIPLALAGHDLIACAATGTGKTAAFVVPMVQWLLAENGAGRGLPSPEPENPSRPRSRVLVLAPTRELAVQIEDEIHGLSYHTTVTSAAVYGGVEMGIQERALRAGVDIIVATPGRLMDHMRQQNADLGGIELLILDEADRMMDMGFWPDVRRIIAAIPGVRQTLLFSATMPEDVVRLALEIVREPKFVQVGQRSAPAKGITHRAHVLPAGQKIEWLIEHLRRPAGPVLIFSRTKVGADRLTRKLAAAASRSTPTGRWISGGRPSRDSGAASTACSSPPTSRRAVSISTASTRSSTTSFPIQRTPTFIGWDARAVRMRWATRSRSCRPMSGTSWRCWKNPSAFV